MIEPKPRIWKESLPGILGIVAIPIALLVVLTMAYKSSPEPGKIDPGVFDTAPPSDVQKLTEIRDSIESCATIADEAASIHARMKGAHTQVEGDYYIARLKKLDERIAALNCPPAPGG